MIFKLIGGPMDGAEYSLARPEPVPLVPDGRSVGRVIAERIMMALGLDNTDFRKRDPLVVIACELIEQNIPFGKSTNRKPDGLWFDGKDEHGRTVYHQYRDSALENLPIGVAMIYKYDGQVVDTGIEMETACEHGVKDGDWCEPCNKAMKAAQVDPNNETGELT